MWRGLIWRFDLAANVFGPDASREGHQDCNCGGGLLPCVRGNPRRYGGGVQAARRVAWRLLVLLGLLLRLLLLWLRLLFRLLLLLLLLCCLVISCR